METSRALALGAALFAAGCIASPQGPGLGDPVTSASTSTDDGSGASGQGGSGAGTTGSGAGSTGPTAHDFFDTHVAAEIESSCAACHAAQYPGEGPDYLGDSTSVYYASLDAAGFITAPANSMLLLKGAHTGPAWTPSQAEVVTQWLDLEAEERGLDTGTGTGGGGPVDPPGQTLEEALQGFAACMSTTDWEATGMDTVPNQNTTAGPCKSCHQTGTGGAFLSGDPSETFQNTHQMPYILKLVLGTVNPDGSFKDLVPANRFIDKGSEGGQHPKFLMTPERALAIQAFFGTTYDKWKAGPCAP